MAKKEGAFMKSILIIGLGRFGHHLCKKMVELGNDVMVIDIKEEVVEDLLPLVTSARVGDCTNEDVIRHLGVGNFDVIFVCIGNNFQSSLEITNLVKEYGGTYVISKANRDIHAKFLLKNGADEVIYPDRDIAEKTAVRCSSNHVYDYFDLDENNSIYEILPLKEWIGKSIFETDIRAKYNVNIIGIKSKGKTKILPSSEYVFHENEHLMVVGNQKDINNILKRYGTKD